MRKKTKGEAKFLTNPVVSTYSKTERRLNAGRKVLANRLKNTADQGRKEP
jgi:hypothetical protein